MGFIHKPLAPMFLNTNAIHEPGVDDRLLIPEDGESLPLNHPPQIDAARPGAGQAYARG